MLLRAEEGRRRKNRALRFGKILVTDCEATVRFSRNRTAVCGVEQMIIRKRRKRAQLNEPWYLK